MFSPITHCTWCGDGFDPVEYVTVSLDPDEPRFCSDDCEEAYFTGLDLAEAYDEAGTGAPLW